MLRFFNERLGDFFAPADAFGNNHNAFAEIDASVRLGMKPFRRQSGCGS